MLQHTFLARCDNRASLPRQNQTAGSPDDWFNNEILTKVNLLGFTFDFFVNWTKLNLGSSIWVKRILKVEPTSLTDEEAVAAVIDFEGKFYLDHFIKFASIQNLKLSYLLFREIDWGSVEEEIIGVTFDGTTADADIKVTRISLAQLGSAIRFHSGGAVYVGAKGLTYGTSQLECFLSKTDSAYPGDCDLLIVDIESLEPKCILEFKKHNLNTPISMQKLSNYYPAPDKRKYDRLAMLRNGLEPSPKLINIYYPTNAEKIAKIESYGGGFGTLKSLGDFVLDLPTKGDSDSYSEFVAQTIAII